MRQCLGCREVFPKRELIRVVRFAGGRAFAGFQRARHPAAARYLCGKPECLKKAHKSRAIERVPV
ncbi:MAG: YlxR family protein [Butyricicoccaceae bacterium]